MRDHAHSSFGMTLIFYDLTLLTSLIIFSKNQCHTKRGFDNDQSL